MTATDPVSWSGEPAEFDDYAAEYKGGLDNPVKRLLGNSPDQFIAVKARWLMRHEPMLETGGLAVLDYGCGVGSLMRVLAETGARAEFTGCRAVDRERAATRGGSGGSAKEADCDREREESGKPAERHGHRRTF